MARPSEYDLKLCEEVCARVSEGENIKAVLNSNDDYPTFQTWCNWKRSNHELFDLYVNAMQDKSESCDSKIDEYCTLLEAGKIEPSAANVLIQTQKWKASKYYPKMFGDKVQQEHSGEIKTNPSIPIVLADGRTFEDLKNELRPE